VCLTCDIINSDFVPVGGVIYKDDYIVLHHCVDVNIPGYLILSPLRHVESYSDLNEAEILQIGIIIKLAVTALEKIDGMEKVYIANFGEQTTHFHMHIFPRYKWMLQQCTDDIYTDNKVDGPKLLSCWRKQYKTAPDGLRKADILTVIQQLSGVFKVGVILVWQVLGILR
jgi:diadenosine tetraphosphate (Ap4A) HIT family hydrolase